MKKLIIILTVLLSSGLTYAQSDVDALRYSLSGFGLSARSSASGGAFGSIGADLGALTINPASMAQYKSSEFSISLGTLNAKNSSEYIGRTQKDNTYNFNMPSLGIVFTNRRYQNGTPSTSGWVNTNIGFSVNRTADFNRVISYTGVNGSTSLLDYFAEQATSQGYNLNQIAGTDEEFSNGFNDLTPMFWESYLIDSIGDRQYAAAIMPGSRDITQKNVISTSGRVYDYTFSLSGNYENKLYVGGDVHISSVQYEETNRFSEFDNVVFSNVWDNYEFKRNLITSGTGIGGRLGVIYRANDMVRAGISYQTPTLYSLTDQYSDELRTVLDDGTSYSFETKEGVFDYDILTPAKTTISASVFAGKKGFISADVEIADYSTMKLVSDDGVYDDINDDISLKYGNATNIRIGGEYVIDQFRLRAGYAHYGNPIDDVATSSNSRNFITGGVGIYERNWSLDLALIRSQRKDIIQPYTLAGGQPEFASNTLVNNRIMVTLSTRF